MLYNNNDNKQSEIITMSLCPSLDIQFQKMINKVKESLRF